MLRQGNSSASSWLFTGPYSREPTDAVRLVGTVTAILSIGAGVIHVSAAGDHTNLPVMFVGFLVVAALQVGLGALLLSRRPSKLLIGAALALTVGSIGIWLLSRTEGLAFLGGEHAEPIGFKDGVTVLFELGTVPALLLLLSSDLARVSLPSPRLASQTLAVMGAGCFALLVPALMLGGGEHHTHAEAVAMGLHEHDEDGHEHGDEVAHTDSESTHTHTADEHGAGDHSGGGLAHEHSATQLASTLGASHEHGGLDSLGADRHTHSHSAPTDGSGGHDESGHDHGDTGDQQHDHSDGGGHGDDHSGGGHGDHGDHGDHDDGSTTDGEEPISLTWEPAQPAHDGEPARGSAIVFRSESGPYEEGAHSGEFHHGSTEGCHPTDEQQAVADKLYADTTAELEKYKNNPAQALADGFYQVIGPADRFVHMVNISRVFDPTILEPSEIESFMYAMTDRGLVAIGGMYILPAEFKDGKVQPTEPKHGPKIGGCLTRWHKHGGWVAGISTAGTNWKETPEMLHVWTYPGLDPWSHYDGPELSQLWWAWRDVPSFCRISPGGTNVCFP